MQSIIVRTVVKVYYMIAIVCQSGKKEGARRVQVSYGKLLSY